MELGGLGVGLLVYLCHRAAEVSDGPHFDLGSVIKNRTGASDAQSFFHRVHTEQKVAGNGFLGFGEHAIGHGGSSGPGDELAFLHERLRSAKNPACVETFDPCVKVSHHALEFARRHAVIPMRAANEEQMLVGGLLGIHAKGVSFVM